jgi:hypothetical protein
VRRAHALHPTHLAQATGTAEREAALELAAGLPAPRWLVILIKMAYMIPKGYNRYPTGSVGDAPRPSRCHEPTEGEGPAT